MKKQNPICIGKIDISAAGKGKGLLGDLNGDGKMELVIVQADGEIDDRYVPHQVTCLTAYELNGNMLWQTGVPTKNPGGFGSDFPAQIYDIDGDGELEVLCVMEKKFKILEGKTGKTKKEFDLPSEEAHDCIIICNLSGKERAEDILLKDRYHNIWAIDYNGKLLWKHQGNVGHFPLVYDINQDGYDEIMAGYDLLDHNGKILWSIKDLEDHADCLWIGDVNGDGKMEIAVGGSITTLYDEFGNEIWRYEGSIEAQHIALGKFVEEEQGLQVAGLDRIVRGDGHKGQWDGKDGMFLIDCNGKEIWKEDRKTKGWLTIVDTLHGWNGENKDYILAYRRGGGIYPTLYNGEMEEVVIFDTDGYVLHADLFGRGKEDVIIYTDTEAVIYSGTELNLSQNLEKGVLTQTRRLYNSTLYPGEVYE